MRINIPIKLERYKDHIKECSYQIAYSKRFSMVKIASSKKEDSHKELYICYNPYNSEIPLNINTFEKEKDIYKMYPPSIKVPSKEIYSFMIFSTTPSKLSLEENSMIYNQKQIINTYIKKISKKNNLMNKDILIEDYDLDVNSTLLLDDIESIGSSENIEDLNQEKTQYLGEGNYIDSEVDKNDIISKREEDIKISLKHVSNLKKKYKFNIIIKNINKNIDYNFDHLEIDFYDKENKKIIKLSQDIKLKRSSQKEISFLVKSEMFKDFNMKDLKIKVTF